MHVLEGFNEFQNTTEDKQLGLHEVIEPLTVEQYLNNPQ